MATVTDTDLKELKDLITDMKVNQVRMEERLSRQMATLDEKVSGIDKRLDIIESRVNGLKGWLIGVLFAFVGGFVRYSRQNYFFP